MIVVWVDAMAEVATDTSTTHPQPPSTSSARSAKRNSSSPALLVRYSVPANATTATATDT